MTVQLDVKSCPAPCSYGLTLNFLSLFLSYFLCCVKGIPYKKGGCLLSVSLEILTECKTFCDVSIWLRIELIHVRRI